MKKILAIVVLLVCISGLSWTDVTFYGSARLGFWYNYSNQNWNMYESGVNATRLMLDYHMQGNSRFGAKFSHENMFGNVELGISPSKVCLRHLYGKYTKGDWSFLIGQTNTGFTIYSNQAYGDDNCLIRYGLFYDGKNPQFKIAYKKRFYVMFIPPYEKDVTGLSGLESLIPKINVGYEYSSKKYYYAMSLGANINNYNKDFSQSPYLDKQILSYAVSLTGKYLLDSFEMLAQFSYGSNVGNYGILTITPSEIVYKPDDNSFENTETIAGLFMIGSPDVAYAGIGYLRSCNPTWTEYDAAMSVFIQKQISLFKNFFIVPEVGMFDGMKDKDGAEQGRKFYGGMKAQANF